MRGYIQIPKNIIKDPKLKSNDFLIVVWLKYLMYVSNDRNKISVNISWLKKNIGITDTRTIKKSLEKLYEAGILKREVELERKRDAKIEINTKKMNELPFAQLPARILQYSKEIGGAGIRLLYYYESYINREEKKYFCYASIRTIVKETGLSDKTIKSYNDIMEKRKILKVVRHKLDEDGYDEEGNELWNKYNNHYYVRVENIK